MALANESRLLEALAAIKDVQANLLAADVKSLAGVEGAALSRGQEELLNSLERATLMTMAIYANGKVIYAEDDRRNPDATDVTPNQRRAADATAALVERWKLTPVEDGAFFDLPSSNELGHGVGLCTPEQVAAMGRPETEREPFYDEANPAFCSGFKVGTRLIATAGHCIASAIDCAGASIIFGLHKTAANPHPERHIPAEAVYQCVNVVDGELGGADQSDWRIIEVDRDIDAPKVTTRKSGEPRIQVGEGVTVIGYPMGLPVKIAAGGEVRAVSDAFFQANVDTYGGNSGSAVFNSARLSLGELYVEGILVRGEDDFEVTSDCFLSKRCPSDGCRGEDVTLASEFVQYVQP